jgi:hypothetical protein
MKIQIDFRGKYQASALAEFCKRVTFDDAYRRASGETDEERKTQAYVILEGLADVQDALNKNGFYTR